MELCKRCKKEPARLYTKRVDGKEVRLSLCPACYRALYSSEDEVVPAFGGKTSPAETVCCPSCGTTFADFRATGLLGCAKCYSVFREQLLPTVRYLQGTTRHTGKARENEKDDALRALAEEKYDMLRALAEEQERLRLRLRRAREDGDSESEERLLVRIEAIGKRLSGEEE